MAAGDWCRIDDNGDGTCTAIEHIAGRHTTSVIACSFEQMLDGTLVTLSDAGQAMPIYEIPDRIDAP